jgi:maltose O-acetyltransferase
LSSLKSYIRKIRNIIFGCNDIDIDTLKKRGLMIGNNVFIASDALINPSFPWLISIGDNCFITSRVIILAHDASTWNHIGYAKIGNVSIGKSTFIGVGSIVLPNVTIGDNVIIGAGSVVTGDIPDGVVAAGNPILLPGSETLIGKK